MQYPFFVNVPYIPILSSKRRQGFAKALIFRIKIGGRSIFLPIFLVKQRRFTHPDNQILLKMAKKS
jgi:hypothetical protein